MQGEVDLVKAACSASSTMEPKDVVIPSSDAVGTSSFTEGTFRGFE